MAERAKPATRTVKAATNGDTRESYKEVLDTNGQNLDAVVKANEALTNGLASIGEEVIAFGNSRIKRSFDSSESLIGCKDFEEAFRVQCDYLHKATEDYAEETKKLVSLVAQMTQNYLAPFENRTKETLHQMNEH